ncbi:MAG TPA: MoaD/ThiS family protein [Flavobacteriaceae bacterium]|mgnify:CR=1 FL=1|nr:MoaD/ThiS family protein [Flavobacteriaceae bacterium]MCB9212871.1 MoaD/ThiS family protein [Alteromonas sp.]HPF11457.1 MoaD/ThiS family protein [Flavobacteriaceae bacterium]HQU20620.1 MoaD/ThiS family protein [Flavobacteriaceae bacterium]HQU65057.1 MoaD/ThiS family protein [Flavobacteriaceae bacterium]
MTLTVKYFGMLTEATHCSEEQVPFTSGAIFDLISMLIEKYPSLKGYDFQVAQENKLVALETDLSGGEIALLPPFAGG